MARKKKVSAKAKSAARQRLAMHTPTKAGEAVEPHVHLYGKARAICLTDKRGHATPDNRNVAELVVDAGDGFIPLWAKNTTLRWRFNEPSIQSKFMDPPAAKEYIIKLLGDALLGWGDARPVTFTQSNGAWDFEIDMQRDDNCYGGGCVLASAFFPDGGQHKLKLYPILFRQTYQEQVETLQHEIGHTFGLRHFFAQIKESFRKSQIFGKHDPFSIMNYGDKSKLTAADQSDLKRLYQSAWSGELTQINGTQIRLVTPYHMQGHSLQMI